MKPMPQERTSPGQIFPSPRSGEKIGETPPSFCWLKVAGAGVYEVLIRDESGATVWKGITEKNYMVPDILLEPGHYEWNLIGGEMERGWLAFEIIPGAVRFLRPSATGVLASVPMEHPRHLFYSSDVSDLKRTRSAEIETLKRNIQIALKSGMPEPPRFHRDEGALPYREYFGRHRDFCDRDLVACALGHALLGDVQAGKHAVESLLAICDWNPAGPCSLLGPWGDEVGLSHARCLPAAYDMVWDLLSEKERIWVEQTIAAYARQCEELLMRLDFAQNPGNSHAGRVPAYLGEAALILKDSAVPRETLERWLSLSLAIYGSFFPHFGGPDGGWAEGVFYGSSYTKWYLPFFMAVERFSGFRFLDRPFYKNVIHFFLHFCPPGWESHPFCDGYWCRSDDMEWPGFFAQNPYRLYAQRSGVDLAIKWAREAAAPEIFKLHLLDVFIPDGNPANEIPSNEVPSNDVPSNDVPSNEIPSNDVPSNEIPSNEIPSNDVPSSGVPSNGVPSNGVPSDGWTRTRSFPDAGFISLHTDLANPDKDTALLARASRHGTASHQHPDQGSFALIHRGHTLISPSGYFGREYGTRHHREWTNSTRAHNAILVDGAGQENNSHKATGRIVSCCDKGELLFAELDLAGAYPMLKAWNRRFTLYPNGMLAVQDHIEADKPVVISWLLHTLSEPASGLDNSASLDHGGIHLEIRPLSGLPDPCLISGEFGVALNDGVPLAYHVSMPGQYHLTWTTPESAVHDINVNFVI